MWFLPKTKDYAPLTICLNLVKSIHQRKHLIGLLNTNSIIKNPSNKNNFSCWIFFVIGVFEINLHFNEYVVKLID